MCRSCVSQRIVSNHTDVRRVQCICSVQHQLFKSEYSLNLSVFLGDLPVVMLTSRCCDTRTIDTEVNSWIVCLFLQGGSCECTVTFSNGTVVTDFSCRYWSSGLFWIVMVPGLIVALILWCWLGRLMYLFLTTPEGVRHMYQPMGGGCVGTCYRSLVTCDSGESGLLVPRARAVLMAILYDPWKRYKLAQNHARRNGFVWNDSRWKPRSPYRRPWNSD